MNLKIKTIMSVFVSLLFVIPIYTVLHEGGHALIAVFCGARITKFCIMGAYMSYEGGTFTSTTISLMHVAGMLAPVVPIGAVLAWVIVPMLYLIDKAPQNDDVTKFINSSGLSPWVILFAAIILFSSCFFIAWRKKIIQIYWETIISK